MTDTSALTTTLTRALTVPDRGVVGLVDDLFVLARDHDLRLGWEAGMCTVTVPPVRVEAPLRRSVVRAVLARVAALCEPSDSPYRGRGTLTVGTTPPTVIHVEYVNTPDEQSLHLSPTAIEPAAGTLSDLLARITPENIHPEWDTGPLVGAERLPEMTADPAPRE